MKVEQLDFPKQLCTIMSRIYDARLTTVSGGNLSIKDEDGNIWVTPSGGDKGRYQTDDILKIAPDGTVSGNRKASMETGIHCAILGDRPEFKAVVHAHPPATVAISLAHQLPETTMLPWIAEQVQGIQLAGYACPGTEALKEQVASVFRTGINTAILENHGVFIASEKGLNHAFGIFQNLDVSVRIQAKATALTGKKPKLIANNQLVSYHMTEVSELKFFKNEAITAKEKQIRKEILDLAGRAYQREFMTSTVGVISARIDDDSFIITSSDVDYARLSNDDLVLVRGMACEKGKMPNKSVNLHQKIYQQHPEIQSIIMAAPPNAMVFAVTDLAYDVRTIPECYIVVREISKFPFGSTITRQQELADYFSVNTPVAIVENECFICTGNSVFNAFDRLEVAEFSAEAVCNTTYLGGKPKSITDEQVKELKEKFQII